MTTPNPAEIRVTTAWRTYQEREQHARSQYLSTVAQAHYAYLTGPWPDREYYLTVERDAWATYYAAARDIWSVFKDAVEAMPPPPPPPPDSNPYPPRQPRNEVQPRLPLPSPAFTPTTATSDFGPNPQSPGNPYADGLYQKGDDQWLSS